MMYMSPFSGITDNTQRRRKNNASLKYYGAVYVNPWLCMGKMIVWTYVLYVSQ